MEEIWKPVPIDGFRERYEVSNLGNVRRVQYSAITRNGKKEYPHIFSTRILKQYKKKTGYLTVALKYKDENRCRVCRVHRLVAMAFLPNPDNLPVVEHIDADCGNNVVSNLRWTTVYLNNAHPITRARRSESMKKRGGHKHTEETKKKLSALMTGRKMPQWVKDKISTATRGKKKKRESL